MKFLKVLFCSVFMLSICIGRAEEPQDNLTRLNSVPSQGLSTRITSYIHEHAVCMILLGAALGYIYVKSVLDAMKPNPYEGPLKEAHQRIAELENALLKLTPIYRVLAPALKLPL
jgi:hypothetical protein